MIQKSGIAEQQDQDGRDGQAEADMNQTDYKNQEKKNEWHIISNHGIGGRVGKCPETGTVINSEYQ